MCTSAGAFTGGESHCLEIGIGHGECEEALVDAFNLGPCGIKGIELFDLRGTSVGNDERTQIGTQLVDLCRGLLRLLGQRPGLRVGRRQHRAFFRLHRLQQGLAQGIDEPHLVHLAYHRWLGTTAGGCQDQHSPCDRSALHQVPLPRMLVNASKRPAALA
jgi:hypothetical protein